MTYTKYDDAICDVLYFLCDVGIVEILQSARVWRNADRRPICVNCGSLLRNVSIHVFLFS